MDLGLSGLASGFDWRTLVDQLSEVERAPERRLTLEQSLIQNRRSAYGVLVSQLNALKTRVDALKEASLFSGRTAKVSDSTIASASAATDTPIGSYSINIVQLATAAAVRGSIDAGAKLSASGDVSALTLANAPVASTITAGTFTINGTQITVATTDTLQAVFDRINAALGDVAVSYNSTSDKVALTSGTEIVLGSATDTSNFLSAFKLYNNGTGTVESSSSLGVVKTSNKLGVANTAVAITDGGAGAGQLKVNGVTISYNASADTINDVLARINNSSAGVTAAYDPVSDRFSITNRNTGDIGIALQDVTGNFLAATGLTAGSLQRGKNLLYSVNSGDQLINSSNTVAAADSSVSGLSFTALKEGTVTIDIASDQTKVKTAITDFISEYNKTQALLDTQTASSTDAKGKVTAGVLATESEPNEVASKLRAMVNGVLTGLSNTLTSLNGLGISSNGTDNNLALTDASKLDAALGSNMSGLKDLFSNATNGVAVRLSSFLEATSGEEGSLISKQDNLTKQSAAIDTQITDLERLIESRREQMIASFVAMERAQARINQQMQFLSQRLGAS